MGRVLDGRFRLDRVLSAGGMGLIFEATQLSIQRRVAVKLLKPTLSRESDLTQRFALEIDVVAQLKHPHIIPLIDAGVDASGLSYLVMEFFEGDTFRVFLQRFELTLVEILEIFIQVCGALLEAHGCGVIHRDLKFDNIMVTRHRDRRLHVKILDFGVAKLLHSDANLTRGGQVPGTPGIIAPELVDMQPPSARSDLYSLGVLMFTALSGQAPYVGDTDLALMRAHKLEPIPKLRDRAHDYVPDALIVLITQLLAKDPADRPRDARAVRERLEQLRERLIASGRVFPVYVPPSFEDETQASISGAFSVSVAGLALPDTSPEGHASAQIGRERAPLMVPTSIVGALVFLLIVLVAVLIFLLYQLFVVRG